MSKNLQPVFAGDLARPIEPSVHGFRGSVDTRRKLSYRPPNRRTPSSQVFPALRRKDCGVARQKATGRCSLFYHLRVVIQVFFSELAVDLVKAPHSVRQYSLPRFFSPNRNNGYFLSTCLHSFAERSRLPRHAHRGGHRVWRGRNNRPEISEEVTRYGCGTDETSSALSPLRAVALLKLARRAGLRSQRRQRERR